MEHLMTRHIVFGTGQIGRPLIEQLTQRGHDVVAVNRSGRGSFPGARVVGGDAADPDFTTSVSAGADVAYFCLNAANYARWDHDFPPLQRGVIAGATSAGARLVVLENLYSYGPQGGRDLVETMAANPTSTKSATRAAMTQELLQAHGRGQVEVAIGRASDYFGPGATRSALGENVFGHAVAGKPAQVLGKPDQLHSYSYTPDVAAALVTLGTEPAAAGEIWHLPVTETRTTRQIIEDVCHLVGTRPRTVAAGPLTLRLLGLVKPEMREFLNTLYQFTQRWVVDDRKFTTAFSKQATPVARALATTVDWYREEGARDHPRNPPA
jgi:nucleoside-diphosphate-sugar epimerase